MHPNEQPTQSRTYMYCVHIISYHHNMSIANMMFLTYEINGNQSTCRNYWMWQADFSVHCCNSSWNFAALPSLMIFIAFRYLFCRWKKKMWWEYVRLRRHCRHNWMRTFKMFVMNINQNRIWHSRTPYHRIMLWFRNMFQLELHICAPTYTHNIDSIQPATHKFERNCTTIILL